MLDATSELGRDLGAYTVMFHSAVSERLGLNATDHKALDLLSRAGALTAGELAELVGLTTGAVTGMVDRLEQAGYVRRVRDPNDRRKVIIEPIAGHERMQQLDAVFASLRQKVVGVAEQYSDEQLATVIDFLSKTIAVFRAETTRLRDEARNRGAINGEA